MNARDILPMPHNHPGPGRGGGKEVGGEGKGREGYPVLAQVGRKCGEGAGRGKQMEETGTLSWLGEGRGDKGREGVLFWLGGGERGEEGGVPCPGWGRERGRYPDEDRSTLHIPLGTDRQTENITFPSYFVRGGKNEATGAG